MVGDENIIQKNSRVGVFLIVFLIGFNQLFPALTKKRQLLFFFDKIEINGAIDVFVKPGERIAQLVIAKYEQIKWKITQELPNTIRGDGGFGSTGKK